MATLIPWTNVEIGDLDVFTPFLPSFLVYTWYVDDEPESIVTHVWRDENTGMIHHETVLVAPVTFEEAVSRAQEEAPKRSVERIHVKHARASNKPRAKGKRAAKTSATSTRKRPAAKRRPAKRASSKRARSA